MAEDNSKLEESIKLLESKRDLLKKNLEIEEEIQAKKELEKETAEKELELTQARLELRLRQIKAGEQVEGAELYILEILKKQKQDLEILKKEEKERSEELQKQTEALEKQKQKLEELRKEAEAYGAETVRYFSLSGRTFEQSLLGRATKFGKIVKDSPEDFKNGIRNAQPFLTTFAGIFDKIAESTFIVVGVFDQIAAGFNRASGAAGEFNSSIIAATEGAGALGVGIRESTEAMNRLYTGFADFNLIGENSRNEMIKITAALENVGVSAQTTAENINFLVKGMGMTADEATETQVRLAEFAKGIGVAPSIMADNFKQAQPIMVQYGNVVGNQVFQNLTKQAKATGLAMGELLAITGQFDTFEGAANAAGKLNALLGGNLLNSVELLTASEDQRIMMLRRAIDATGRSFGSMNKFEQQSIAAAAGINDMTKAAQLFGTTDAEFERISEEQADLAEMTARAQSVTQKLEQAFQRFAIAIEPLADGLNYVLGLFVKFVDNPIGRTLVFIAGGAGLVMAAFKLFAPVAAATSALLPALGAGAGAAGSGVGALGAAAGAAAAPMGAFSIAASGITLPILAIAAAIPLTVLAVNELVETIIAGANAFSTIGDGVAKIAGTLSTFGIMGIAAGAGAISFAAGLGAISEALSDITNDELFALAYFTQGLGSITESSANAFAEAMNQLNTALATANDVGTDTLEKATALVSAINQNQAALIAPAPTTVAAPVTQMVGGGGGSPAGGSQMATVILQLNDREFGRAVVDIMENKVFKLTS